MYHYWQRITIANAQVAEDDADYTFLFSSTIADLATVANGGRVENTASGGVTGALIVPADLVFSSSPDGSSKYDFEIESYDAATGEIVAWVQSGVLSATDTVLYVVYGNKAITTSQENINGTWDSDFVGVWHLAEAAGDFNDSTGNGWDSADYAVTGRNASGKINGAVDFELDNDDYINVGEAGGAGLTDFLVECWIEFEHVPDAPDPHERMVSVDDTWILYASDEQFRYTVNRQDDTTVTIIATTTTISGLTPYYAVGRWDLSDMYIYVDGDQENTAAQVGTDNSNLDATIFFGTDRDIRQWLDGRLDEVRLSSSVRTADYVTTTYNSQNSPGTFYSVGDPDRVRPTAVPSLPGLMIA